LYQFILLPFQYYVVSTVKWWMEKAYVANDNIKIIILGHLGCHMALIRKIKIKTK